MDCPSCAGKVDKSLQRVDGIVDTTLQPTTGTASVTYDPDRVSESDLVDAIEGAGYKVVEGAGSGDGTDSDADSGGSTGRVDVAPPAEVWTSPRAIKTWIGAVLVTLGLLFEFVLTGQNPAVASVLAYPLHLADVLFLGAVVVSGYPVVRGGYYSARNRSLDIDLLMGTAIIAATGIGYFVEAATLAVLFSIAELLEDYSMDRARDSLRELMELSPDTATVRRDGEEHEVSPAGVGDPLAHIRRDHDNIPRRDRFRRPASDRHPARALDDHVPLGHTTKPMHAGNGTRFDTGPRDRGRVVIRTVPPLGDVAPLFEVILRSRFVVDNLRVRHRSDGPLNER
jgi:Cd2+/Zn2+-exporting ATPase